MKQSYLDLDTEVKTIYIAWPINRILTGPEGFSIKCRAVVTVVTTNHLVTVGVSDRGPMICPGCQDVPDDAHHLGGAQAALPLLRPRGPARDTGAGAQAGGEARAPGDAGGVSTVWRSKWPGAAPARGDQEAELRLQSRAQGDQGGQGGQPQK